MLLTYSLTADFFIAILTLIVVLISYWKWSFLYWERKKLHYLPPEFPYGNVSDVIKGKENFSLKMQRIYEEMKSKRWKHGGIYILTSPVYFLVNLDYIKNVTTKNFDYFTDRADYFCEKADPLSANLFNLGGTRWRNLKPKLTPTFTSGKIKMMFDILTECGANLVKRIDEEIVKNEGIDIKEIVARFTSDVIGSYIFGLDCKALENKSSPFRTYGRKLFAVTRFRRFKKTFCDNFPNLALYLNMSLTPNDVTDFFMKAIEDTVTYRKENNYERNDFLQLLIEMKNTGSLKIEGVAAQSFIFFLAGFETSSILTTFALYELSRNQDIQKKLRKEVNEVLKKHDGKVTYESIQDMKYLSQVIDESMRMYPVPAITRRCVKDYKVPNEDLIIEKGTYVIIPILAIHHDEEYYPNPKTFDPERFNEENKNSRHGHAYIPFGVGPRMCPGMKFGLMQVKVGLSYLIRNYQFTINKRTQEPLKMKPNIFLLAAQGEIWLDAKKL